MSIPKRQHMTLIGGEDNTTYTADKINIGETLSKNSTALTALRSAVSSSVDFDDFKVKALVALQNL